MKRIPVALASLTLMGATNNLVTIPTFALDAVGEPVVTQENGDTLYLKSNIYDKRFNLDYFMLSTSVIQFKVDFSETGQYIKRMILVYYDYENGITEAMADARLPRLGLEDYSDWAVKVDDIDGMRSPQSKTTVLNTNLHAKATDGKVDLLYYAVEYGTREELPGGTTQWSDTAWIRGKLDYRNCMHSQGIDVTKGAVCRANGYDEATGVIKLLVNNKPVDEKVISWPEEWRLIQEERLEELAEFIEDLEKDDQEGNLTLELLEEKSEPIYNLLNSLGTTLSTSENVADLSEEFDDLEERFRSLLAKYNQDDEDEDEDDDDTNGTGGDRNQDSATNQGSNANASTVNSGNNQSGQSSGTGVSTTNSASGQAETRLAATSTGSTQGRTVSYNYSASNRGDEATDAATAEDTEQEAEVSANNAQENKQKSEFTSDEETENGVDLPALGGEKPGPNFLWLLIPVVGVLIMAILWLKRQRRQA